jgi:hypothetical protein
LCLFRQHRSQRDDRFAFAQKNKSRYARLFAPENGKGCDIGYAPAICSCEGADSVDACTVAALDAITAFAVPNPNCSSQESVGFFGSGCSSGCPVEQITQPTSDWQDLFRQSFQPSTGNKLNSCFIDVNLILGVKMKYL